jgi:hypothetical protein
MSIRVQLAGAYAGLVMIALLLIGFWAVAGFVPPPSPADGPDEIAAFFRDNTTGIRLGMWITVAGSALLIPWCATIAVQMNRIEGPSSPLTYIQLIAAACLVMEFIFPPMVWQAAAFRPDGDPEITQRLNDLAWLPFLGIVSTAIVEGVAIGLAILKDPSPDPLIPRWAGWFNIWVVSLFAPAGLIVFFKHGPLAWNGIFSWWLALLAFFLWLTVFSIVLIRAIKRQAAQA